MIRTSVGEMAMFRRCKGGWVPWQLQALDDRLHISRRRRELGERSVELFKKILEKSMQGKNVVESATISSYLTPSRD
jgi:hypothetical protein